MDRGPDEIVRIIQTVDHTCSSDVLTVHTTLMRFIYILGIFYYFLGISKILLGMSIRILGMFFNQNT